jgi:hypothetical protein
MPRGKVNKAAKIRDAFSTLGKDARPKDVIAVLAKKRVRVSSAQVSAIKSKLGNGNNRIRQSSQSGDSVSLDALLVAKSFVDSVGTVAAARAALDALARIVE